jgi:hypothetical protein
MEGCLSKPVSVAGVMRTSREIDEEEKEEQKLRSGATVSFFYTGCIVA